MGALFQCSRLCGPLSLIYVTAHENEGKSDGISSASACNRTGNDLHHHANYPSQHNHYCPKDVRIFTKHDHNDRYKSRPRSEKCAYGTEKFCSINLSIGTAVKSQRGSINSQVKPNCATNHH